MRTPKVFHQPTEEKRRKASSAFLLPPQPLNNHFVNHVLLYEDMVNCVTVSVPDRVTAENMKMTHPGV